MKHEYREAWLDAAMKLVREHFKQAGYKVPDKIGVTCGWPSRGATSAKNQTIGQCWDASTSSRKYAEIFISPVLDDAGRVLDVLIHEAAHAVVGCKEGHNAAFGKCARAVGLEGKLTATVAGDDLKKTLAGWKEQLGPYPHKKVNVTAKRGEKGSRLLKMECGECGCVIRTTQKWQDEYPDAWPCPCGGELEPPA